MRNPAHFGTSTLIRAGQTALLATTLAGSLILAPVAMAQDATPAASPAASPIATAEARATTLMQARFDEFVPAPMTVRMLRITVDPGASTPMHTHPGPEFDLIESGSLTIRTEGDATITRANGDTEAATTDEQTLEQGDWILYPAKTGMFYQNTSDQPVVLLSAVLLPVGTDYPESITYTDGQPTQKDFDGVSFKVLGDGLVQTMPKGSATVTISSIDVPAGADLPAADGVAMYSQVDGNFSFVVDSGAVQVSRSKLQSLQSNAVAGEEFSLDAGDAAFFPAGVSATSRADQKDDLKILALTVEFASPMDRDAAALTFTKGPEKSADTTSDETATSEDGKKDDGVIGALVTTNVDELNLRAEPNTESDVVDQLAAGVEVEIIGGPEQGENYTWYEVKVAAPGGNSGWVASDFLDGIPEAAATTPTPASTPASSTTSGTFSSGEVVVTTEDSVRIRAEGNLGADIIDAFPAGTEYEITGSPIDADGYTWYPVSLVDDPDISGWIPADFLAPAE